MIINANNCYTEESIKNTFYQINKFYIDSSSLPGLFQCLSFPYEFLHSTYSLLRAKADKNREAIIDLKLNLFTISANSLYSFFLLIKILSRVEALFSRTFLGIVYLAPITGISACLITGGVSLRNLKRQFRFYAKCKKNLKLLKENPSDISGLKFLQKYTGTSSQLDKVAMSRLANRIKPWLAEQIARELPSLMNNIQQSQNLTLKKESITKAIALITTIKKQSEKKLIQETLFLIANIVLISAFATILLGQPYLIPLALFAINMFILIFNYIFSSGTLNHAGWEFRATECIPQWMKTLSKQIHTCFFKTKDLEEALLIHS